LWFADLVDVHRASASGAGLNVNSLVPIPALDRFRPFWVLSADMSQSEVGDWPSDLGAPTNSDGSPKMFGDRMVWTSRTSTIANYTDKLPVPGFRVGITNFLFESGPLKDVYFVRYDVQNETTSTISDVYMGVHGHTGINANYDDRSCREVSGDRNRAGYLMEQRISYTYAHPESVQDTNYPEHCFGFVAGMVVLPLTESAPLSAPMISNRILGWYYNTPYASFAISELWGQNWNVFKALLGRSPDGKRMIDPVRDIETDFAFPGDPIQRTGWFSEYDTQVHSLQTFGPLLLEPSETQSFVVAYLNAQGEDLPNALDRLPKLYESLLANRSAWDK